MPLCTSTLADVEVASLVDEVVDYAVIGLDQTGHVLTWNAGAERLKGYTRDQAIGLHVSAFYPEADRVAGLPGELLARAITEGRVRHTGWRVRRDGRRFWGDVTITAVHDEDGAVRGFAKVTHDTTEAHRVERLRQALLAGLAHQVNEPALELGGLVAALSAGTAPTEEMIARLHELTDALVEATDRLRELASGERRDRRRPAARTALRRLVV